VRIWTMMGDGRVMHDEVVWRHIMRADSLADVIIGDKGWEPAAIANTPPQLLEIGHGTFIKMVLRKERTIIIDAVQRELSRTYGPGLRAGRVITFVTKGRNAGTQDLADNALAMPQERSKRVKFDFSIEHDDKHLPVQSAFGLIDGLASNHSHAAIGFGPRVIMRTRDCFVGYDGRSYSGRGVAGWVDLGHGWQDYLTVTKDEIADDELRLKLMTGIFDYIKPLLERTEEEHLTLILQGIALDLQSGLNNLSNHKFAIHITPSIVRPDPNHDPEPEPNPDPQPCPDIPESPPDGPNDDPGDTEHEQEPAESKLRISLATDDEIEGALCRLNVMSDKETSLVIEVNKDHSVIEEALKANPVNRMALSLMATREIAAAIIKHDNIIKRALTPQLRARLEAVSDEVARERLLARILMDATRFEKPPTKPTLN